MVVYRKLIKMLWQYSKLERYKFKQVTQKRVLKFGCKNNVLDLLSKSTILQLFNILKKKKQPRKTALNLLEGFLLLYVRASHFPLPRLSKIPSNCNLPKNGQIAQNTVEWTSTCGIWIGSYFYVSYKTAFFIAI